MSFHLTVSIPTYLPGQTSLCKTSATTQLLSNTIHRGTKTSLNSNNTIHRATTTSFNYNNTIHRATTTSFNFNNTIQRATRTSLNSNNTIHRATTTSFNSNNTIHRLGDNILLTRACEVKLCDFGLARKITSPLKETLIGTR